jgi:N12 class adenine-specific DNA methylase
MREEKSLDKYFITRSLDNLVPGGTMALIVHPGVLANKTNEEWRYSIARKGQFLGAVKLNNDSFYHANTTIQPDILLFKKHPADIEQRLSPLPLEEFKTTVFASWASAESRYFEKHPGHIMGEVSRGTGQWGSDEVTGSNRAEDIEKIIEAFTPEKFFDAEYGAAREQFPLPEKQETKDFLRLDENEVSALQEKRLLPGMIKTAEAAVYILSEDRVWSLAVKNDRSLAKRLDLVKTIANEMKSIRSMMREGNGAVLYQNAARESLYFYKSQFGSYPPEDRQLLRFMKNNPAVSGLFEGYITPEADILNVPNLYDQNGKLVNGHNEAVRALQTLQGDMKETTEESILKYFPDNGKELIAEMYRNPDIFLTLDNAFLLREDFIAGNAWDKIDAISAAAGAITDEKKKEKLLYGKNELAKAAGWVPIEDADFTPHSSWIPEYIINHWIEDEDGLDEDTLSNRSQKVSKNGEGKWGVKQQRDKRLYSDSGKDSIYEGDWDDEADPVIYYLNMQKQRSRYYDTETFNREHNENFKNYIACHKEFREELERRFNRIFNAELSGPVKTYPVYLDGWREEHKTLRGHQWQSVHHLYRQGKGISALGTGFGKTLAATALHTLLQQEGKIKRAWFQVPNNKVKDWIREIHDVLPDRKIGFVDPEMRGYSSREVRYALYQRLANSDYDIILMPESAASEIQLNAENDQRITDEVVSKHIAEKGEGKTARKKEQIKESSARSLENGKTNKTITFEDFGCDAIFVDEAHRYKNLFSSNLSRETGLNDGRQSAKAMALFKKTEYIRRNNDGKNIFLLTATPLTNSPLEYYNMLMYVAPEELEKFHIHTIDGFIKNFANIETGFTYDWKTGQVGQKKILTGFKNIQALQNIFFKYTDYQNDPVKINLEKPDAFNKPNLIPVDAKQSEVIKAISAELERYQNTPKKDREALYPGQNFLTFYSQLRTASLDIELYEPDAYQDWKNPKLEQLAANTREIYQNTKAGQVVFCDRVFSSDASFDIHRKIKKSLVSAGFKDSEIVIVNGFTKSGGAQSDSQIEREVSQAVEKFNNGTYKVLIGSTACIGEGLNLQENSAALHHFDIPYRPSDFIQRNGRIDRQGNSQDSVHLHTYMSAGTIDNYSVSLVQRKANWIDQLLKTKSHVFVNPNDENFVDADELLLALTGEWGDASGTAARREEMNRQKAEKMAEAQDAQRKELLAQLSLLRGSLKSFEGDKGSPQYQNRVKKINIVEKAILNNPSVTEQQKAIAKKDTPFLYSKDLDQVVLKGDLFFSYGTPYEIAGLNFKKREFTGKPLREGQRAYQPPYSSYAQRQNLNKEMSVVEMKSAYNFTYYPQPSREDKKRILLIDTKEFYKIEDEAFKEKHYGRHLKTCHNNSDFTPVQFFSGPEDGKLTIQDHDSYYTGDDGKPLVPLNPFNESGREKIREAVKAGVDFDNKYRQESQLQTIGETLPEIHRIIEKAIAGAGREVAEPDPLMRENTPEHFRENLIELGKRPGYRGNVMAAAQYLIRTAEPSDRERLKEKLISLGCADPESTRKILAAWIQERPRLPPGITPDDPVMGR